MRGRAAVLLAAIALVFFAALTVQRGRSTFLAVEARAAEAGALGEQFGVPTVEVLALHELLGGRLPPEELRSQVQAFADARRELGDAMLAVLALRGKRDLAVELLGHSFGESPDGLRAAIHARREAVDDAVRFDSMVERFARREH